MIYILASCVLFLVSVYTHMIYCRWRKVRTTAIRMFCFISLIMFCELVYFVMVVFPMREDNVWELHLQWTSLLLFAALVPFYISFYHMIVVNSPTRLILDQFQHKDHCTYQDLLDCLTKEDFFQSRLDALVEHGVVQKKGDLYQLSSEGRAVGTVLALYQKIVGRSQGG